MAAPVLAVDGVIEINQARAMSGGVTPGDTPGFPVIISQAGSYRLTGHLNIERTDVHGIEIYVGNVTIDLNGFTIAGPTVCSGSPLSCSPTNCFYGGVVCPYSNCSVFNGSVIGMNNGIQVGPSGRVQNVNVASNFHNGIITGKSSVVTGNTSSGNGRSGISADEGSVVTGNTTNGNGESGISANEGAVVTGNTASNNILYGIYAKGLVTGNYVINNGLLWPESQGWRLRQQRTIGQQQRRRPNLQGGGHSNWDQRLQ